MSNERATRVGVKIKPPTLIVVYTLNVDSKQIRIRKIPIKVGYLYFLTEFELISYKLKKVDLK